MKNFDLKDLFVCTAFAFVSIGAIFVAIGTVRVLAKLDVNAPPTQVCIQGVMYFEETLTPVYDVMSLNPVICERGAE